MCLRPLPFGALVLASLAACSAPPPVTAAAPPPAPAPTAPVAPSDPATTAAAQVDALFAKDASGDSLGCGVGVYRAGEIVFAKRYGYADLDHDVLIGDTTAFYLASV